jgi:hypothetical protein
LSTIVLTGIPGFDGSYEIDFGRFTNRELHMIKQLAGVRLGELSDAFAAGDNDVLLAIAKIAVKRAGKDIPDDLLWEAEMGSITFDVSDLEEDDELPPGSAGETETSSSEPAGKSNDSRSPGSGTGSGSSANDPSPIGNRGSATGVTSPQPTSVT